MRVWQSKTAGLDREWVLVGLMAVTAAMSAFAFWQATTFGDEAAERRAQERVAVAEVERNNGALRAQVDFDLRVDTAYCAAAAERDATLVDALVAPTDELAPLVGPLVAGNLEARSLGRLTQADLTTGCGTNGDDNAYKTESAVAWAAADAPEFQRGGPAGRAQDVAGPDRAEHRLMVAAVAFAVALLLLTAIDLTRVHERTPGTEPSFRSSRWRRIWAGLAVPALASGIALVVMEVPLWKVATWVVALGGALVLPGMAGRLWGRRRRARRPAHRTPSGSPSPDGRLRWWAELAGAVTLVAFAGAALGLAAVSQRDGRARADADLESLAADRLLEQEQQAALRDLSAVGVLAAADASLGAANQSLGAPDDAERVAAQRSSTAEHARVVDQEATRDIQALLTDPRDDRACPQRSASPDPSYDELMRDSSVNPTQFLAYGTRSRTDERTCAALAATSRLLASRWDQRAALFTVALVFLGLAGFLLALAADPDRTASPARWLLWVGVAGSLFGTVVAASVPLMVRWDRQSHPDDRSLALFAQDAAEGEIELDSGRCDAALHQLNAAIARFDDYAPALLRRAEARVCRDDDDWLYSPAVEPEPLEASIRDLEEAQRLGWSSPDVLHDLAWFQLVRGLQDPERRGELLDDAAELTTDVVDAMEDARMPSVHGARLNRALAQLAIGDDREAEAAYGEALRCLQARASCPGGGVDDSGLDFAYAFSALGDLELLEQRSSRALDHYREVILRDVIGAGATDGGGDGADGAGGWRLAVFPRELQVEPVSGWPEGTVSVVWYHRPPPDDIWSVVLEPTAATLAAYTGGPVPASEILPDGEYRADVYVDGRLVDRVVENNREGWNDTGEPLVAPELGIGGVVGADWRRQDRPFGVEVAYTAPSTPESAPSLVLRRDEGQRPDGDVDDWMDTTLDDWVAQKAGEEVVDGRAEVSDEPQWFLGLPLVRVHEYPGVRAFIGYGPYFSDLADPTAHPDCGGTTFMALVSETPEALTAYESLFLESNGRVIAAVPEQDDMAVEIPEGWAAAEWSAAGTMGSRLAARDCATGANLRVTTAAFEPAASFEQYAQDRIAEYDRQLDGFQLYSERTATVTGGREAVELAYGFVADGTGLTRRELLAVEGTTVHSLTFTTPADLEDDYAADRDSVVQSFRLTRT